MYFVLFYVFDNEAERRRDAKKISVNLTHKKIFDLTPDTDYVIYVSAVTSAGQGPSQFVAAKTRQYAR